MKIGVLGTGDVGRSLAAGLAARGHEVMIGSRDPTVGRVQDWLRETGMGVQAGTFAEAAAHGEVLVLSVNWGHAREVIELAGRANIGGKVLIDTSNPLRFEAEGELPVLDVSGDDSAGERIQRWLPDARVVKAFNIVNAVHMVDPDFPQGGPDMFICGNDDEAKYVVADLISSLGWPPAIDLGDIRMSRYLEPLAMVWIVHFFRNGFDVNHAFKLLRK
ncbi:MAG: NADPH-dependent F420 reductase [Pseudomonadota bacterium]|nr:NADPH-dependent F420 reductase [Pseudomonadota bacterium]